MILPTSVMHRLQFWMVQYFVGIINLFFEYFALTFHEWKSLFSWLKGSIPDFFGWKSQNGNFWRIAFSFVIDDVNKPTKYSNNENFIVSKQFARLLDKNKIQKCYVNAWNFFYMLDFCLIIIMTFKFVDRNKYDECRGRQKWWHKNGTFNIFRHQIDKKKVSESSSNYDETIRSK